MDTPFSVPKTSGWEGSAHREAESLGTGLLASMRAQKAKCGPVLPTTTFLWPCLCTSPHICHPLLASPQKPLISVPLDLMLGAGGRSIQTHGAQH